MREEIESILATTGIELGKVFTVEKLKQDLFQYFGKTEIDASYVIPSRNELISITILPEDEIIPYHLYVLFTENDQYSFFLDVAVGGTLIDNEIDDPKCGLEFVYDQYFNIEKVKFRVSHDVDRGD